MIRLGLCCIFINENIKFKQPTATSLLKLSREAAFAKLSEVCLFNANSLLTALKFCDNNSIKSFRVSSRFFPLKTHPVYSYEISSLKDQKAIFETLKTIKTFSINKNIRLTFHPDQFVVLNSPYPHVVENSIKELKYHAEVAHLINADVLNIHGGGAYGNKKEALEILSKNLLNLPKNIKKLITLENDDKIFTPKDLLPICKAIGIPLVYDVHHHKCNNDGISIEKTTKAAISTWNREPLFHISSPLSGYKSKDPKKHHDYINIKDFPKCWRNLNITVEVEAKAKELAIKKLTKELNTLKIRLN